ncbi:hypothetical protein [Bacillus sp. WP8]|nr:hypothetical protein [Bacillus sp. WP8]
MKNGKKGLFDEKGDLELRESGREFMGGMVKEARRFRGVRNGRVK